MRTRPFALSAALTACAIALAPGCDTAPRGEPVAVRPALTVYPIRMAGEDRTDVAEVVALALEQRGMNDVAVAETPFTPDPTRPFAEQAEAFAAFAAARSRAGSGADSDAGRFALYGAVLGSPRDGVQEIRGVLAGPTGTVAWSERHDRTSAAMKRARPADPMTCTLFLVDRLAGPLDLLAADEDRTGPWAEHWRVASLAPTEVERREMATRRAQLLAQGAAATALVHPARVGDDWSVAGAERLAAAINARGLLAARVAPRPLPFEALPSRNEQRTLWSAARSIRDLLRANPAEADYVIVADFMLPGDGAPAGGVHTFLVASDGAWVIVDYRNDHHEDFVRAAPATPEACAAFSADRLAARLAGR